MALFFGELKEVGFRQNLPLKPLNLLAFLFGAIADMVVPCNCVTTSRQVL
jgi:hypothetical protein